MTERFNSISKEESLAVKNFIFKIEGKIDLDIYKDYDRIKDLGEIFKREQDDIDLIRLYVFLTVDLKQELEINEVRDIFSNLEGQDYIQVNKYLLFYNYSESKIEELSS